MRRKTRYKRCRWTTQNVGTGVVYSYIDKSELRFINGADGVGCAHYEFDIDVDLPQRNEYQAQHLFEPVSILWVEAYNYKRGIVTNQPRANMIDFNRRVMSIPYAIRFEDDGKVLVLNQKTADKYALRYPQFKLHEFLVRTLLEFSR